MVRGIGMVRGTGWGVFWERMCSSRLHPSCSMVFSVSWCCAVVDGAHGADEVDEADRRDLADVNIGSVVVGPDPCCGVVCVLSDCVGGGGCVGGSWWRGVWDLSWPWSMSKTCLLGGKFGLG